LQPWPLGRKREGRLKTPFIDRTPEREPQQAAPSSFISPGATADGKIKNEGQGCQAGGGRKISSEGMAGAIIEAWIG